MKPKATQEQTTHFGYQEVPISEKAQRVAHVFDSVANKYDVMNDAMSFGMHRVWKRFAIEQSGVRAGQHVLDVAGGTGDLTARFAERVGKDGLVVLSDINDSMLVEGRSRLIDKGIVGNVVYVQGDAESLPFPDNSFDCISIAFGLRNVTNKDAALRAMYRVLKPGGKLLVLEFSQPVLPGLKPIYDAFSFTVIPFLGRVICNDADSYQYLVESIRKHPDQKTLQKMLEEAGFEDVQYHNLSGGIVALHSGYKY